MLVVWKPIYETGVDFIDDDHRKLADSINEIESMLLAKKLSDIPNAIVFLARNFDQHCAREEAAMRKISFSGLEEHTSEHNKVKDHLSSLVDRVRKDTSGPVVEAVIGYLGRWFHDHVVGQDLQLRDVYQAAGLVAARRAGILARVDAFLARFKVRTRILVASLIPTILAVCVAAVLISGKYNVVKEMGQMAALADYAVQVGNLVHELQRERGLTALFLGGDPDVQARLAEQREKADRQRAAVTSSTFGKPSSELVDLEKLRTAVRNRSMKTPEIVDGYSAIIANLLSGLGEVAQQLDSARISNQLTAYLSLAQGKERAGQERAIGTAGFAESFPEWRYKRFIERSAQEKAFFNTYIAYSNPDRQKSFNESLYGLATKEFEDIRASAKLDLPPGSVDPRKWFMLSTKRIDTLKVIEDGAATYLKLTTSQIGSSAKRDLFVISLAITILAVFVVVITLLIVRSVVVPFQALSDTIHRIGDGEKDALVTGIERIDEIGDMARTIMVFRSALLANDTMLAEQAMERAFNDTRIRRRESLTIEFDEKISQFVGVLASSSTELVATAGAMTSTANETKDRSTTVAAASEQTSVNIQTVASAVEELSSSVHEITRQVTNSARMSAETVQKVDKTDATVAVLSDAAQKIGDIVNLINDIALQTNLQALNATIEAARAGEAGKGFAVVANEVKQLSTQTAKATNEIGDQIKAIQNATQESVSAIRHIGSSIREINGISTAIASAVEQQSAATSEISRNVQEAAKAVGDVNQNILSVAEGADQTGTAATQVLQAAGDVSNRSEMIRLEVEGFLSGIRTA